MEQLVSIKSRAPQRVVTLTDGAIEKVAELVTSEGDDNLALRMAVRPGGCSGFSYDMFFTDEIEDGDTVEEFDGNVRIVVDDQSISHLKGATLDYQDGLMGAGFAINNPNVTRSCGCGNSFS